MNLNYHCKHIKLDNETIVKEPIIRIALIGANDLRLTFTAILDSGSDFILLPSEVADILGINYNKEKKETATTYGGTTITTTKSRVKIVLEKDREKTEFECICAVLLDAKREHEHIIFGSSFFEHFKIIFDYSHNKFQIIK